MNWKNLLKYVFYCYNIGYSNVYCQFHHLPPVSITATVLMIHCYLMSWLKCSPAVSPGWWLEMTTTARAPAESTQLWNPGTLEGEPSSSRALPESTVTITAWIWYYKTGSALLANNLAGFPVCRNQPEEAGPAATDLQQPVRLRQDPPWRQDLHQRAEDLRPWKGDCKDLFFFKLATKQSYQITLGKKFRINGKNCTEA